MGQKEREWLPGNLTSRQPVGGRKQWTVPRTAICHRERVRDERGKIMSLRFSDPEIMGGPKE